MTRLALLLLPLLSLPAAAHNNYFLPGDAFFASTLKADTDLDAETLTLRYRRYSQWTMKCGYFGYTTLSLTLTRAQREHLEVVRKKIGKDAPLLVYDATHPLTWRIWLRYNEHRAAVHKAAGMKHVVRDGREIKALWPEGDRDAAKVPGFTYDATKLAPLKKLAIGGTVDTPVVAKGEKMFIVPTTSDYPGFAQRKDGLRFYVVKGGVSLYEWKGGKAVLVEKLPD